MPAGAPAAGTGTAGTGTAGMGTAALALAVKCSRLFELVNVTLEGVSQTLAGNLTRSTALGFQSGELRGVFYVWYLLSHGVGPRGTAVLLQRVHC